MEELRWLGDGFSPGHAQVGRSITYRGRQGVVVKGSELTITVCWTSWLKKLWQLMFKAPCPWCGRYHD